MNFLIALTLPLFAQAADIPSVHGMLLFGSKHIYISHLPMFHSPHDYQMLAELELPPEALAAYQSARHKEKLFTLVPERFSLPEMAAHPKPFKAVLYQGHFERGGNPISKEISVKILKVLHFRKFQPEAARPEEASALLFGEDEEFFSAHFISAKPDFDQVSELALSQPLPAGKALLFEAKGVSNLEPLPTGKAFTFKQSESGQELELQVKRELYFETDDLAH